MLDIGFNTSPDRNWSKPVNNWGKHRENFSWGTNFIFMGL